MTLRIKRKKPKRLRWADRFAAFLGLVAALPMEYEYKGQAIMEKAGRMAVVPELGVTYGLYLRINGGSQARKVGETASILEATKWVVFGGNPAEVPWESTLAN